MDVRGRTRWQIEDLQYPIDAQVLDAQRVLVTEYAGRRVTERNHKGEVLWQTPVDSSPIGARRLANGNTFIATRTRVFEVDRSGTEVWTLNRELGYIVAACSLHDGQVALVSRTGGFERLDRTGKILQSFPMRRIVRSIGTHIQVLPNGHVLVPFYTGNCVMEYDAEGKPVWTAQAYRPTCVQRCRTAIPSSPAACRTRSSKWTARDGKCGATAVRAGRCASSDGEHRPTALFLWPGQGEQVILPDGTGQRRVKHAAARDPFFSLLPALPVP